jgi:DNA gyrase subunit A
VLYISSKGRALCAQGTVRRGGTLNPDADDPLAVVEITRTDQERLVFTDRGRAFRLRLAELPLESRRVRGAELSSLLALDPDGRVVAVSELPSAETKGTALFITAQGNVKRTAWSEFSSAHSSGILACRVGGEDAVVAVSSCGDDDDIVLVSSEGKVLRFSAAAARPMGRSAGGVRGMKIGSEARIVGGGALGKGSKAHLLVASEGGFAKRVAASEIPAKGRGGAGLNLVVTSGKYGKLWRAQVADPEASELWLEASPGRLKAYPISKALKGRRGTVPKRWPIGSTVRSVFTDR